MTKGIQTLLSLGLSEKAGLAIVALLILGSGLGPLLLHLDPYTITPQLRAAPGVFSGSAPVLGTDDLGRDVLARLVYGARTSVSIGLIVVVVSMTFGSMAGLVAGVVGGWTDTLVSRVTDVVITVPGIMLAIVVSATFGSGAKTAMLAAIVVAMPGFVRTARSVAALEARKSYVQAARTCGSSTIQILLREVLPNCWGPIIAQATLGFAEAILSVAALGFLGLGVKSPQVEWGAMLADARPFIESNPSLIILPGICLMTTVFGISLLGDSLQKYLNPKQGSVK
jgi:dipeptide transport system permease protein